MRERLYRDFPPLREKGMILMNPAGGILPIRAWPPESFIAVARELLARGYAVAVTGFPSDRPLGEAILAQCHSPSCANLAGYTRTVRELMVLFHLSRLLITNDGGPGQISAMTPVPAILLFGPETPVLYGVLNDKTINLFASLSCSPCLTAYNHRNSPCRRGQPLPEVHRRAGRSRSGLRPPRRERMIGMRDFRPLRRQRSVAGIMPPGAYRAMVSAFSGVFRRKMLATLSA